MTTYHVDTASLMLAERFRIAEEKVAEERGSFSLFGLFETEDMPGRWDLVASAPWLETGYSGIKRLIDALRAHFDGKDWQGVSVVVPMTTETDFVRAITRKYQFEHQVEEIGSTYANGVYISHAFLITSNPSPSPAQVIAEPVAA